MLSYTVFPHYKIINIKKWIVLLKCMCTSIHYITIHCDINKIKSCEILKKDSTMALKIEKDIAISHSTIK